MWQGIFKKFIRILALYGLNANFFTNKKDILQLHFYLTWTAFPSPDYSNSVHPFPSLQGPI